MKTKRNFTTLRLKFSLKATSALNISDTTQNQVDSILKGIWDVGAIINNKKDYNKIA